MTGAILLALLPVVLLTALGFTLRRRRFLAESFWPQAERLGYFVLLPSLFFHSLATAHVEAVPVGALALTLILSTVLVAGLVIGLRPLLRVDGPAFTSVFQGSVRFQQLCRRHARRRAVRDEGHRAGCDLQRGDRADGQHPVRAGLRPAWRGAADAAGHRQAARDQPADRVVTRRDGVPAPQRGIPPGLEPALRTLGAASLPIGLLCVGAALDFSGARTWIGRSPRPR